MTANEIHQTSSLDRSQQPAKVVLWAALITFAASQFFPFDKDDPIYPWAFGHLYVFVEAVWTDLATGGFTPLWALLASGYIVSVSSLIVFPCLYGFLSRSRPIVWIMRLIAPAFASIIPRFHIGDLGKVLLHPSIQENVQLPSYGFWVFLLALVLNTLGLWMIPKTAKHQPFIAPKHPNTNEN